MLVQQELTYGSIVTFQDGVTILEGTCVGPSKLRPGKGHFDIRMSLGVIHTVKWNSLWKAWVVVLPQSY